VASATFFDGLLSGQIALLTIREAESIVEKVSSVEVARRSGLCPSLSTGLTSPNEVVVQVRRGCGSDAGTLLNNYTVDRRTGTISPSNEDGGPVLNSESRDFARHLVEEAHSRVLSNSEAACVALEAAKGLPGWSRPEANVTVGLIRQVAPDQVLFTAVNQQVGGPIQTSRFVTVDPTMPSVRDDELGITLSSARLGSLLSKIIELREPPLLTDEEALAVALSVPAVASRVESGCWLSGGGAFSSDEVFAGVSCDGDLRGDLVSIILRTGQVANDRTREVYQSEVAARLARRFLADRESQRSELRKEIQAICGA
jgi:hypothetical protein